MTHVQSEEQFLRQVKPLCKIIKLLISDNDNDAMYGIIFYKFNACDVIYYEDFDYLRHIDTINKYYLDNQYVAPLDNLIIFYYDTFYRVDHSYYSNAVKYIKKFIIVSSVPDIFRDHRYFSWNANYAFYYFIRNKFPSLIQYYDDAFAKMKLIRDSESNRLRSSQKSKEIVQSIHDKVLQLIRKRIHLYSIKSFIISLAIRNEANFVSRFANNRIFDTNLIGEICQFFFIWCLKN